MQSVRAFRFGHQHLSVGPIDAVGPLRIFELQYEPDEIAIDFRITRRCAIECHGFALGVEFNDVALLLSASSFPNANQGGALRTCGY